MREAGSLPRDPDAGRGVPSMAGLVVAIDRRDRRHRYAIGAAPRGELVGELGALPTRPQPDTVPVWLTADGRLATELHDVRPERPSPRELARWAADPLLWSGFSTHGARLRSAGRRSLLSPRLMRGPALAPSDRASEPAGYLHAEAAHGRRPLYAAIHPVTKDQLLTTVPAEATDLGYGEPEPIGYVIAAAPVTGELVVWKRGLSWARRFGMCLSAPDGGVGRGHVDRPTLARPVERDAFHVTGWALFDGQTVARAEVRFDGRPVGLARLGLYRPDVASYEKVAHHPDAPVSGFSWTVPPSALPEHRDELEIDVLVTGVRGDELVLPVGRVRLAGPPSTANGWEERTAELRARSRELATLRRPVSEGAVNVIAFTHRLDHGGAQRYFFDQVRHLAEAPGFTCTVVAPQDGPWRLALEALGVPVHVTAGYPIDSVELYEAKVAELVAWAGTRGFDAAFVNTLDAFIGADAAHRLGIPAVWGIHESFDFAVWWLSAHGSQGHHPYVRERARESLGGASALLFAADATRRMYEGFAAPERLLTAPYGLDLPAIDAFRERFDRADARRRRGIPADDFVVLCLGIVQERKAQVPLAQAFAAIAGDHPRARLAVVGADDSPYSYGLRRFVRHAGLGERCSIVPATSDAYAWHALSDLFVLPSDVESSPIAVLEAMAFGLPTLATNVFGVPELIEEGRTGYMCAPNDVADLSRSLDAVLCAKDAERSAVARAGSAHVRIRHDPNRYAINLQRLLGTLVDDPAAPPGDAVTWRTADGAAPAEAPRPPRPAISGVA